MLGVIAERFDLDRADYAAGAADHELFAELRQVFSAHGHDWAVFLIGNEYGADEEWIYLGDEPIRADRVR